MSRPDPALVREWNSRLRASGLVDVEARRRDGLPFERGIRTEVFADWASTAAYYRAAGRYAAEGSFACERSQSAWAMHAEGATIREICRSLHLSPNRVVAWLREHRTRMVEALNELVGDDDPEAGLPRVG